MSVEKIEVAADADTITEWQQHFVENISDEGLTPKELAKITGFAISTMREKLKVGVENGTYTTGTATRRKSDGSRAIVTVYQLVKKPPAKKKR